MNEKPKPIINILKGGQMTNEKNDGPEKICCKCTRRANYCWEDKSYCQTHWAEKIALLINKPLQDGKVYRYGMEDKNMPCQVYGCDSECKEAFLGKRYCQKHYKIEVDRVYTANKFGRDIDIQINKIPHKTAQEILNDAEEAIGDRAKDRDTESERSMRKAVEMFNTAYGKDLTEEQGWMFACILKIARSSQGAFRLDDYIDGAAYFALAAESVLKQGNHDGK